MTVKSGITAQFGASEEVTVGTPVAPSRWFPILPPMGLKGNRAWIESESQYAGRRAEMEAQRTPGAIDISGPLNFEVMDRNMGFWFKQMLGGVATTGPVSSYYDHTFTVGELSGKSVTAQAGLTEVLFGGVVPFTYSGLKIASWELAWEANKIATLGLDTVGKDEILHRTVADGVTVISTPTVTSATAAFTIDDIGKPIAGTGIPAASYIGRVNSATSIELSSTHTGHTSVNATANGSSLTLTMGLALGTPSYTSGMLPMSCVDGAVTIGGTSFKTKDFKVGGDNGLDTDRNFIGQRTRDESLEAGKRPITGTINGEFWGTSFYKLFCAGTPAAVVATIRSGLATLVITMNVRFTGDTPEMGGKAIVKHALPFECLGAATDATSFSMVYHSLDTTP